MDQVNERIQAAFAGLVAAALFGGINLIARLTGGPVDTRTFRLSWANFALGTAFGGFAGFYWSGLATRLLSKYAGDDRMAVAAGLGILVVPLMPILVTALARRLERSIGGPKE